MACLSCLGMAAASAARVLADTDTPATSSCCCSLEPPVSASNIVGSVRLPGSLGPCKVPLQALCGSAEGGGASGRPHIQPHACLSDIAVPTEQSEHHAKHRCCGLAHSRIVCASSCVSDDNETHLFLAPAAQSGQLEALPVTMVCSHHCLCNWQHGHRLPSLSAY